MKKKTTYKIIFMQLGEIYEIFAKQIYQSDMYGFIEVEEYIFNYEEKALECCRISLVYLQVEYLWVKEIPGFYFA